MLAVLYEELEHRVLSEISSFFVRLRLDFFYVMCVFLNHGPVLYDVEPTKLEQTPRKTIHV